MAELVNCEHCARRLPRVLTMSVAHDGVTHDICKFGCILHCSKCTASSFSNAGRFWRLGYGQPWMCSYCTQAHGYLCKVGVWSCDICRDVCKPADYKIRMVDPPNTIPQAIWRLKYTTSGVFLKELTFLYADTVPAEAANLIKRCDPGNPLLSIPADRTIKKPLLR